MLQECYSHYKPLVAVPLDHRAFRARHAARLDANQHARLDSRFGCERSVELDETLNLPQVVDELRNGIETLGADAYEKLTYYERWIASVTKALLARGVITTDELGRGMAAAEGKR